MSASREKVQEDLFFEDVGIGRVFRTPAYTITDEDIQAFCDLTFDHHPLHTDDAFARSVGFSKRIAHGLYGLALAEGLKTKLRLYEHTSIASLGWDKVRFHQAVLSGDRVEVAMAFQSKRTASRPDRGVAIEAVRLERGKGELLISAEHATMLKRREI